MNKVTIREVGPRDGLQREAFIKTAVKRELIERLEAAGCREIEATSFASPQWIPQFADAFDLTHSLSNHPASLFSALVPNQKGFDSFLKASPPLQELCFFIGATDTFNRKNVNRSTEEHLTAFLPVAAEAQRRGIKMLAYLSVVCGCPYEGAVAPLQVAALTEKLATMGFERFSLGDTIGIGTPKQVEALVATVRQAIPVDRLIFHAHNTYGRGVANAWAAYSQGVRTFDSSIGGLGGCPYAPGAKGNVATEDLVDLFERSQIKTGLDLGRLHEVIDWMRSLDVFPKKIGGESYRAKHAL